MNSRKELSSMLSRPENSVKLRTLYCSSRLDLEEILKNQSSLKILGLYVEETYKIGYAYALRKTYLNGAAASPSNFVMEWGRPSQMWIDPAPHHLHYVRHLSVFLAFYPRDLAISQVFAQSLDKNTDTHPTSMINQFSIYFESFADLSRMRTITKGLTRHFPASDN